MIKLSERDAALLDALQEGIPFCERPYLALAKKAGGFTEEEVITRIKELKEAHIIRRMSGFFNSRTLGYRSLLCAAKVKEEDIDAVAELMNGYQAITHNYVRTHELNLWFTLICRTEEDLNRIIGEIEASGLVDRVRRFPRTKGFKIHAAFDLKGKQA